jgi:hypothetical protein
VPLFHEFHWVPLEPFLAGHTAEMVGFPAKSDFELGCFFIQYGAANRVFGHYEALNLNEKCTRCLL